jgi:hypothetical protein
MKYTIISVVMLCLIFLNSTAVNAQVPTTEVITDKGKIGIDSAIKQLEEISKFQQLERVRVIDEPFAMFYKRADSLHTTNPVLQISQSLQKTIKALNTTEPYLFLSKAQDLYESNPAKADDITVLMYIGLMRFDYYVSIQPDYQNKTNKGWMKYETFIQQNYKSRIELYLASNIEKYKQVLKYAIDYCNNNDYAFCDKAKETLIHKKVMQQYENLLYDLTNNKESLSQQWAAERATRLKESSVQQKSNKNSTKDALLLMLENLKMEKERQDLWAKIQIERVNLNSDLLKQYIRDFNAVTNKMEEYAINRRNNSKQEYGTKTTEVLTRQDNSTSIYTSSKTSTITDTTNSTLDLYNYYDKLDERSKEKTFVAKVNANILKYINTMKWDDEKKLSVFKLFQYHKQDEPATDQLYNTTYLKNADANTKPAEDFTGLNIHIKKGKRKHAMLLYILGEVEGTLVSEDLKMMIHDLDQQTFPNSN